MDDDEGLFLLERHLGQPQPRLRLGRSVAGVLGTTFAVVAVMVLLLAALAVAVGLVLLFAWLSAGGLGAR